MGASISVPLSPAVTPNRKLVKVFWSRSRNDVITLAMDSVADEQSMLINVAEFVQNPKRVPIPSLICLYLIDDEILDCRVAFAKTSLRPDFACEAFCVVGEWKPKACGLAGEWVRKRYCEIVECTAKIANCIPNKSIDALVGLMQRIVHNFRPT